MGLLNVLTLKICRYLLRFAITSFWAIKLQSVIRKFYRALTWVQIWSLNQDTGMQHEVSITSTLRWESEVDIPIQIRHQVATSVVTHITGGFQMCAFQIIIDPQLLNVNWGQTARLALMWEVSGTSEPELWAKYF